MLSPPAWKSPALLGGAGRGRVLSLCSGKGERFGNILGAKTAVGDTVAGHLLSPLCRLLPGLFTGWGFLGLGGYGGAKVHPTTANTPACRVPYRPGGALESPQLGARGA